MIKDGVMFCDKCGKKIEQGETVCSDCGTPVVHHSGGDAPGNLCSVLSVFVLVFGTIASIYYSYSFGVVSKVGLYDIKEERNVLLTICIFLTLFSSSLILYAILSTLGKILHKLEHM